MGRTNVGLSAVGPSSASGVGPLSASGVGPSSASGIGMISSASGVGPSTAAGPLTPSVSVLVCAHAPAAVGVVPQLALRLAWRCARAPDFLFEPWLLAAAGPRAAASQLEGDQMPAFVLVAAPCQFWCASQVFYDLFEDRSLAQARDQSLAGNKAA